MERGLLIYWLDITDAHVAVRHPHSLPIETVFHHRHPAEGGRILHVVHVVVPDLLPLAVYYTVEPVEGEPAVLIPVKDCEGYREVLCAPGVEYAPVK